MWKENKGKVAAMSCFTGLRRGEERVRPDAFTSPVSADKGKMLTSTSKDTASVTASIITMEIRHRVGVQTSWRKKQEALFSIMCVHRTVLGASATEWFWLEKSLKITTANHSSDTANSTAKACP